MATPSSSEPDRWPLTPSSQVVGRDRELNRLRTVIERVLDGYGQVVLVSGEAGIGKTTLTRAAVRQPALDSALVLTGHCYDLMTTPPYGPWLEILHAAHMGSARIPLPETLAGDDRAYGGSESGHAVQRLRGVLPRHCHQTATRLDP